MNNNNKAQSKTKEGFQSRSDKLKEIDTLYREQIKKIYTDSKSKLEHQDPSDKKEGDQKKQSNIKKQSYINVPHITIGNKSLQSPKSSSTLNIYQSDSSNKMLKSGVQPEDRIRASMFLKGESIKTMEILRRQNESKELKIRELSNKCQSLMQKLQKHLSQSQFSAQMETLRQFSDGKMERLEHLFKIKQEEIFFKIKLQIVGLLQQFGVTKQNLADFNQVSSESNLFTLMVKKLKHKLKDFRSKQQESSFELQRDKIVNQKQEQRIHYLTQTNDLLKLSESKFKAKIQDLKSQLNDYLQRLKMREQENQENENDAFRLRKQNEQLQNINQKLNALVKESSYERLEDKRTWEAKEKQMKTLLNNYFIEKKKLETDLEEKDEEVEEIIIKQKFLEQENQRISRQLIRWKERYEWSEKQNSAKVKDLEEEKNIILTHFQNYKEEFNQGALVNQRSQVNEAIRKIEEYQRAYERVSLELEDERRLLRRSEEQTQDRLQTEEKQWLERFKSLEKIKEEQLYQISQDCQARVRELRDEFEKKQSLLAQEMQARLRALLAERDKNTTEQLIELQSQNDQLRREVNDLNKIIEVKQSLINVIHKKADL